MHVLPKILLFHVLTCLRCLVHGNDIIHGKKAPENSMQYMASVQNSNGHICGGFLISQDFVVTAAHCDTNLIHVVLGNHNLKTGHHQKINIEKKFKHESYINVGQGNDIMLLKLAKKAQLGNKVQLIPLPTAEINLEENEVCQVAGWGMTEHGSALDELRVVDVSVINPEVCKKQWPGLPANVICAGGYDTEKGFCQGDSGGPLVCKGIAVGVVSFNKHNNCKYPNVPNVYMDISKYLQWINTILNNKTHLE